MEKTLYTPWEGMGMMVFYALVMFVITGVFSRHYSKTKEDFLVAGRRLGKWETAFSIAATWIWAPALFISAQKAYTQGIAGLFWFTVPNVLCLILFARFAAIIREKMPLGFTLSAYVGQVVSGRVQKLYIVELLGLAVCSFAVQLLAGANVLASITGIPYGALTVILAMIALSYSLFSGLKASVITDYAQLIWIFLVLMIVVPWVFIAGGGMPVFLKGLGGLSGEFAHVFHGKSWDVALSFGVPVTIGLMAGPFGDQSFWQRGFAVKEDDVQFSFVAGALIFGLVPLAISVFGFMAAGMCFQTADPSKVNLDIVIHLLPTWVVIPFVFMLLSGLTSTLDSNLCSVSSIAGHDMARQSDPNRPDRTVALSRLSMIVLAATAVLIANIKGLKILHLFLFYGTLRASTFLPTILILLKDKVHEAGLYYGILTAMIVGLPLFSFGKFTDSLVWIVWGSVFTLVAPLCVLGMFSLSGKRPIEKGV